jgi:hypothetical protein
VKDLNLCGGIVERVTPDEEGHFQNLMEKHPYLGALPKIRATILYVTMWRGQWLAISNFSAAALKVNHIRNYSAAIHQDGEKPVLFVPYFFGSFLAFC